MVADLVRGKKAEDALTILNFTVKRASDPLLKLLNSALSNAKSTKNAEAKDLFISKITVDEGPAGRRVLPKSRGRGEIVRKKTSHVTLVLDVKREKEEKPKKKAAEKKEKKAEEKKVKKVTTKKK